MHQRRQLALLVAAALSGAVHAAESIESGPAARGVGLPITFERNDGQFPADVIFASRGRQGTLTLRAGEIAIASRAGSGEPLRLKMLGANLTPEVHAASALATLSHYYVGKQPVENIPHFGELQMKDVYPGIDVALHGRDGSLEYDFIVAPGADPRDIRIDLRGLDRAALDERGNLRYEHAGQVLMQHAPVAYQVDATGRQLVDARFELVEGAEGPEARIALGVYDTHAPLTVDPVISYSTYVGGSGTGGMGIKVDRSGHIYYSYRDTFNTTNDQVLTRLDPHTNGVIYQTHFGGSGSLTNVNALALGGSGGDIAFAAGDTNSPDFPVPDGRDGRDGFVAAFSPTGRLAGGFRVGSVVGGGTEVITAIAIDEDCGDIHVAGYTDSPSFPVTGGQLRNLNGLGSATDAFIAKYSACFEPIYRQLLGGSGDDRANGIAVDGLGTAIVVGTTYSSNFPRANAPYLASAPPEGGQSRGFVARFAPDGTTLYSRFVGGESMSADAVAIEPTSGDTLVGGTIGNANLMAPPLLSIQEAVRFNLFLPRSFGGTSDAFLVRLSPAGDPKAATLLGGSSSDSVTAIAVSDIGDIYVTGTTISSDFPTVSPIPGFAAAHSTHEGFVARFRGGVLDFSTYLGGISNDFPQAVVPLGGGALYVAGVTQSPNFPFVAGFNGALTAGSAGFITKITGLAPDPPRNDLAVSQAATRRSAAAGWDVVYEITVRNLSAEDAPSVVVTSELTSAFIWASPACVPVSTLTLAATVSCTIGTLAAGASATVKVVGRPAFAGNTRNFATVSNPGIDPVSENNSSELSLAVLVAPQALAIPRYRLYSDVTKEHHFTTDLNEYTVLGGNGVWVQEGTVGKILDNPGTFHGVPAVPYYRLYDMSTRWHHWTTDANEYYTLSQYSWWNAEGVDGYILPTNTTGATQLLRLTYPALPGLHHWTIDANEYNTLIASFGWIGEPGAGFVIQ